jgi:glycosyltransferase involved in cell wall biosynthesis
MTDYKPGLSVVASAHNEAFHMPEWLANVAWADEIIVVDSGSTDETASIAQAAGAKVISTTNKINLNVNKNLAIEHATHEWVLLLDPDERLTPELAKEIQAVVRGEYGGKVAFWIPRRTFVLGRFIRAWYPGLQLRLWRNGPGRYACRSVHESLDVNGPTGRLRGDILHYTEWTVAERVEKLNLFSEQLATEWYTSGRPFRLHKLLLEPLIGFLRVYFVDGLFREGIVGFMIAVHSAYSYFLRHAKLWAAYYAPPVKKDARVRASIRNAVDFGMPHASTPSR